MKETLDLFKVLVVDTPQLVTLDTSALGYGYILTFHPNPRQFNLLKNNLRIRDVNVLFFAREAREASLLDKINKQFNSYIASYWLDNPTMFVEHDGEILNFSVINAVTVNGLQNFIDPILYGNKPTKDVDKLVKIIREYNLNFVFDKIKNNELRIGLYDENDHRTKFTSGDDVVRYIIWKTTGSTLLIKSKQVLAEVKAGASKITYKFLEKNMFLLSHVFNRHKNILLSLKEGNALLRSRINVIARLSKKGYHKPLPANPKLTILARKDFDAIENLSIRERLRLLNHMEYVYSAAPSIFTIRNGKLWFEKNHNSTLSRKDLIKGQDILLNSLKKDLSFLKTQTIILPNNIDYGLPISQKQSFGKLPWGTIVSVGDRLSSGIFWRDSWGANDLDLSTLDKDGNRTGWGQYSGYRSDNDILFSGDLVRAPDPQGAMEFMTSSKSNYGLFVNVYNGGQCRCDVVVGDTTEGKWIKNPIIQEEVKLTSKGAILGYVEGRHITLFSALINNRISSLSGDGSWSLTKRRSFSWTVKRLFRALDIFFYEYYDSRNGGLDVVDLNYSTFTFDKLERLLLI